MAIAVCNITYVIQVNFGRRMEVVEILKYELVFRMFNHSR